VLIPAGDGSYSTATSRGSRRGVGRSERNLSTEFVKFGRYVLVEKIGEGASARVYKAVRSGPMGFRKEVAIKQLRPHVARGKKAVKALINEARLGGFLRHPNIVEVHEFDRVGDTFYISMEFIEGDTLEQILQRVPTQGPIPPRIVAQIAIQICRGLAHAHAAEGDSGQPMNLVHRDIKPANFMITPGGVVKIMDFGIARADTNLFLTQVPGLTKGTPAYMSPEQTVGDMDDPLDSRSDLFSLASVIAEMCTGEVAFQADKLYEILHRIARADSADALAAVADRAQALEPVLRRAFERIPDDRYASAEEMCQDLERALEQMPGDEQLTPWLADWTRPPRPPGSTRPSTAGGMESLDAALGAMRASSAEIDLGAPLDSAEVVVDPRGDAPTAAGQPAIRAWMMVAMAIVLLIVLPGAVAGGWLLSAIWPGGGGQRGAGGDEVPVSEVALIEEADEALATEPAAGEGHGSQPPGADPIDPAPVTSEAPAIIFSSTPRGADVILDGRRLGRSSHRFEGGRPGQRYEVVLRKEGYEEAKVSAVFPERGTVTARGRLSAVAAETTETGDPQEAGDADLLDAAAAVSPTTVDAIVGSNAAVKGCFDQEQARGGSLAGRIWLKFVVHPDGHVSGARVITPEYAGGDLERCLSSQVSRLEFPRFRGDDTRVAKHYFDF